MYVDIEHVSKQVNLVLGGDKHALWGAFVWEDHPFGHAFWEVEQRKLEGGGKLSRKAAAALRRLLKEASQ